MGHEPSYRRHGIAVAALAYRRALGFPDRLEDDHYDLANDIAHELKKQTPDFNEFQDQIDRTFNDGKGRYRNEQLKILADAASSRKWKSLPMFLLFGNTYGLGATIANVFFPYQYSISLYQSITEDDVKLVSQFEPLSLKFDTAEDFLQFKKGIQTVLIADVKGKLYLRIFAADGEPMLTTNEDELPYRKSELLKLKAELKAANWAVQNSTQAVKDQVMADVKFIVAGPRTGDYYEQLVSAHSVVNDQIIVEGEDLTGFDNYFVEPNLKNEYKKQVTLVTPFAAEIRRQVKGVAKDVADIHSGWFRVGRKRRCSQARLLRRAIPRLLCLGRRGRARRADAVYHQGVGLHLAHSRPVDHDHAWPKVHAFERISVAVGGPSLRAGRGART